MLSDKVGCQDVFHIARIELRIGNAIEGRIYLRILNRLGYILNTYHLARLTRDEIGNRTSTGIEVINALLTRQLGKVARYLI